MTSDDPGLDLVLEGGTAYLGSGRTTTAVGVRGGRIVAVGEDEVGAQAGPATERVDLAGGLLVPGFQDAHVHPVQGGLELMHCDLSEARSREETLALIGAYAASHPEEEWITGGGWTMSHYPGGTPTAAELDAVVADRPVLLSNRDHHSAWANSLALRMAGITSATPDPPDGRIERSPDGSPTGALHEGAMGLVGRLLPEPSQDDLYEALLVAQAHLHSLGITAWQDAIVGPYAGIADPIGVYQRADRAGTLTATVIGALWWERSQGEEQLPSLIERRNAYSGNRFRPTSVKIMQDGVIETCTAALSAPYHGPCGGAGHTGASFVDPARLPAYVTRLDAEGFQVHFHAIGDRAIKEALDAIAEARQANGPLDHRHHIAHVHVVDPVDVRRFADLGVTANMQPFWAAHEDQMDSLGIPALGPDRAAWQYPFASFAHQGVRLAGGSDWPVTTADPIQGIHVAVNRQHLDEAADVFFPVERLTVDQALDAYTSGSAYVNHRDDSGVLRHGAVADLAVIDRDIRSGAPEEIGHARVSATYIDGVRVH